MRMRILLRTIIGAFCMMFLLLSHQVWAAERPLRWHAYIYSGGLVDDDLRDIFVEAYDLDYLDTNIMVFGGGREIYHYGDYFTIESEGQVASHFGGMNDHYEFNLFLNWRWQLFPWDRWIDTSFVWGNGFSYATKVPPAEFNRKEKEPSSKILFYIFLGLDFAIPKQEDWSLFLGIHHRSGVFGAISDVKGGSNALIMGLKKKF